MLGINRNRLFVQRLAGLGSVLAFHRVGEPVVPHRYFSHLASARLEHFRRLIEMLVARSYDIVSMTKVARRLAGFNGGRMAGSQR
jgi:hypothetical protein